MEWWYFLVERHLDRMAAIAAELGDDLVNAAPALPGANTTYQIVFDSCGMLEWWTREAVLGHDVGRDREAEFVARGSVADLAQRVDAVKDHLRHDLTLISEDMELRGDP